ncbi:hypothetical protein [Priestia flexa]|uniref:Uncharacterized protein n=1 Tax=Priestia flexa TaxID=86664 RepID=A0ABU4JAZ4_9BACI|nr:hypothetical protein [Priestia flexa]MCA1202529.1 hypothetical protein [Priestia flexa]MDW8518173.1 hypothetical protein [Priestia flexa]
MDGNLIRKTVLEVVNEMEGKGPGYFQQGLILRESADKLNINGNGELERVLLTYWHDLFRNGYLAWGYNLANPDPPFVHITEQGRLILSNLSRDPSNPEGYLVYLANNAELNPIAKSYLEEALLTFNQSCFKAAAVMIGAAAESMILELRDTVVSRMKQLNKRIPTQFNDWRIKTVSDQIEKELNAIKRTMPHSLKERYESIWSAFFTIIRMTRNEAGHPTSVNPVTFELVHSNLLIFPELAKLITNMKQWIENKYE